jgi:hypothetical protein
MTRSARPRAASIAVLSLLAALARLSPLQAAPDSAREIIDRYFAAVGGRDKIEALGDLVIGGYYGNVFLERGDSMTLYLKKPHSLRRESYGRVVTFDGEKGYMNTFGETTETAGDNLTSLRYYAGFYHNGFSLLKFGDALDKASYLGEKTLGPQREHVVSIPYQGTDYEVHILSESLLVDRIVFPFGDPLQGTRMVNTLEDYREFHGVLVPTAIVFEVVGREAAPMKLEIVSVESRGALPDSLFERPDIRIDPPVLQDGVLSGFVYDKVDGNILTNVRRQHMESLGVAPGQFITFEVGGKTMSVRYVEDIHTGFKGAQLGDYMAIYYQTPLLSILLFGEGSLADAFEFEKGQAIKIWGTKEEPAR